jgi:hypothetical protein
VPQVLALARRVEAHRRTEIGAVRTHGYLVRVAVVEPDDGELLATGQPE